MKRLFILQTVLIAIIGLVHITALHLHLYWLFTWLDTFVHFFSGMWVMLAAMWMLARFRPRMRFPIVFFILFAISVGWEFFEVWAGIPRKANYVFDTTLDLSMDLLGGICGYFIARRMIRHDTILSHGKTSESDPS